MIGVKFNLGSDLAKGEELPFLCCPQVDDNREIFPSCAVTRYMVLAEESRREEIIGRG